MSLKYKYGDPYKVLENRNTKACRTVKIVRVPKWNERPIFFGTKDKCTRFAYSMNKMRGVLNA